MRFRNNPPTAANARRCLPVGQGVKQEGIRMQSGTGDLIWQEAVALNMHQGAGKMKKSADRAVGAYRAIAFLRPMPPASWRERGTVLSPRSLRLRGTW